jgi:hypothetical protein
MSDCPSKIDIGDLCWDDVNKTFGVVANAHSSEVVRHRFPFVIEWNNGKRHWVDYMTAYHFKHKAWHLHE